MAAIRQQRGKPWRGQVQVKAIAAALDLAWTLGAGGGSTITLTISSPTGLASLNGIPQVIRDATGLPPSVATLTSPTTIDLTYSSTILAGETFTLAAKDPAYRTTTASYLAAGIQGPTGINPLTGAIVTSNSDVNVTTDTVLYDANPLNGRLLLPPSPEVGQNVIVFVSAACSLGEEIADDGGTTFTTQIAGTCFRYTWDGSGWAAAGPL